MVNLACSDTGEVIVAASYETPVVALSRDFGVTWTIQGNFSTYPFSDVAISGSGSTIVLSTVNQLYISHDSGVTFTAAVPLLQQGLIFDWGNLVVSSDGQFILACNGMGGLYISSNAGRTFEAAPASLPVGSLDSVAISSNGKYMLVSLMGAVYVSTNYGLLWSSPSNFTVYSSYLVQINQDGEYMAAFDMFNDVHYVSTDFGATFEIFYDVDGVTETDGFNIVSYVIATNNPSHQMIVISTITAETEAYISHNFGRHWSAPNISASDATSAGVVTGTGSRRLSEGMSWSAIATDAIGVNLVAYDSNSQMVYTSNSTVPHQIAAHQGGASNGSPTGTPTGTATPPPTSSSFQGISSAAIYGAIAVGAIGGIGLIGGIIYYILVAVPVSAAVATGRSPSARSNQGSSPRSPMSAGEDFDFFSPTTNPTFVGTPLLSSQTRPDNQV